MGTRYSNLTVVERDSNASNQTVIRTSIGRSLFASPVQSARVDSAELSFEDLQLDEGANPGEKEQI